MSSNRLLSCFLIASLASCAWTDPVSHTYNLKNVLWKLSFSMAKGTISGDVTNTVDLTEVTDTVEFDCEELHVSKVTVNGVAAPFTTAGGKLTVTLATLGEPGQVLKVRTLYSGAPVRGLYFVPGSRAFPSKSDVIYTQGEGEDNHFWLPTYDKPDDKATTECFVTVPKGWTAISNGALLGVAHHGASDVFHWKMPLKFSTYLISLVAGPFVEGKEQWHGVPVDFYVPPGLMKEGWASFGATPKMIDLYSKLTGVNYPWPKFAQEAVGDFMFGGMENVSCVTQTIRTLHPPSTEPVRDSTYLVAHELAHHWFGDLITCRSWEHAWLNEGFATTLPMFYDRATHGQDAFDLDRYRNFEGAIDTMGMRGRKAVPGTVGSVANPNMGSIYDGGCSRIMMLYRLLGEQRFWKAIHAFLEAYKFQPATTEDFFAVVSKSSEEDLSKFVKQWYHSPATPSLTASIDGGDLVIDQLAPFYTLDLPVWVWADDSWVKKSIHVNGAESRLTLGDLATKPLLVDPEVWTPMELTYRIPFTGAQVRELYAHAPNAAQRARLVAHVFDSIPLADRIAAARTERTVGMQQIIADHLGAEGESYLLEMTMDPDQRVVNSAVAALGRLKDSPAGIARLRSLAARDPNEAVRENATQALLNNSTDSAFAARVWQMHAFDDGYRVMALSWMGKNEAAKARALALKVVAHPDSEPVRVAALNVLGVVKDAAGGHAVYDALIKVAEETSFAARTAAINALGQLGDKAAIQVLKPFTKHGPGGVEGAAQGAIDALSR
ncbi:MAG: M1 family aminopeptidase [Fimbriimonadaceae bacterium]